MALDAKYTVELTKRLEPYDFKWIEEPLMPDEYAAHALVASKLDGLGTTSLFATGEHEYTRWYVHPSHIRVIGGVGPCVCSSVGTCCRSSDNCPRNH